MWGLDMVFVVGGNGGNAGANAIQVECAKQDVACCVVGIPKSIDNDILLVSIAVSQPLYTPVLSKKLVENILLAPHVQEVQAVCCRML